MYPERYVNKIDEEVLDVLREVTEKHDQDLIRFTYETDVPLHRALGCKFEMLRWQYYKHCMYVLALERIKNRKEIQQLKDENEALKKEVNDTRGIISTYNRSYLQRTKVKNGVKIAKKNTITKEAVQQLKEQNLSITQISNRLGCSRSTIWRRLNE